MSVLKLVNNTGLKSERNLCYVNTELQLLHSIIYIREFFTTEGYKENQHGRSPVCDELSRIFKTAGNIQTSAAELRRLVGSHVKRVDISNGSQQDIEEFHRLLFGIVEKELGSNGLSLLNKLKGQEQIQRKFVDSTDGCCSKGHISRTEVEDFKIMKINVPNTRDPLSLNYLVRQEYSDNVSTFLMKCSDCCDHHSNCPQTGNCRLQNATGRKILISAPTILIIQLFLSIAIPNIGGDLLKMEDTLW